MSLSRWPYRNKRHEELTTRRKEMVKFDFFPYDGVFQKNSMKMNLDLYFLYYCFSESKHFN